jgi:hypothetical protein
MFEKIKNWYRWGLWNQEMVWKASSTGRITPEEAMEILAQEVKRGE